MDLLKLLSAGEFMPHLLATAVIFVVLVGLRFMLLRVIRRVQWGSDRLRLQWNVQLRRGFWLVLGAALLALWGSELRGLAFSLVAIAVAIVLATKELLICVWGSVLRASAKAFHVGDRIEVDGMRGDVVDHGLFATTVLEIGPGHQRTGRAITIPNSIFLNTPVINETYTDAYVLHVINIPLHITADWESVEKAVLEHAQVACAEHVAPTRDHMTRLARENGLTVPSVEPRVIVQIPEPGLLHLSVRVPTPATEKGRTEQHILRALLASHGRFLADSG